MRKLAHARSPRAAAALTALLLGVGGVAAGCGNDNEGPAEDAGKELDEAGRDVERELDEETKNGEKD